MLLNYQGSVIAALLGLALAAYFANRILSIEVTDNKVQSLSDAIRKGSMAFLKRQYSWVSIFVVVLAVLISTLTEWGYPWGSLAFVGGALFSSLAGFIGMRNATGAKGRTTEAARDGGTLKALPVAVRGGAVMGFSVAGLGLLGVALGYWVCCASLSQDIRLSFSRRPQSITQILGRVRPRLMLDSLAPPAS